MSQNPYSAPNSTVVDRDDGTSADVAIREEHIRHERVLRSIGSLYLFGTLMTGLISIVTLMSPVPPEYEGHQAMLVIGGIYAVITVATGFVGYGFRRLRPWVRVPATVVCGLGLLAIPIGTLFNGYILFQLWGQKGKRVLAEDYRGIIDRTPHVRYRRTAGDWIALAILLLIGLGIAAFVIAAIVG